MPDENTPIEHSGEVQPPQQVFPNPENDDDLSVTATSIRELREDVLRELADDAAPPVVPPARGIRIALGVLLFVSLGSVCALWLHDKPSREARTALPAPAATAPAVPNPDVAKGVPVTAGAEPAPADDTSKTSAAPSPAPDDPRLAEITVLNTLADEDAGLDARKAIARLETLAETDDGTLRLAAHQALAKAFKRLESQVRSLARAQAETAEDHAGRRKFARALETLDAALLALPGDVPWAVKEGHPALERLRAEIQKRRDEAHASGFGGLPEALRSGAPGAQARLQELLQHPDKSFREEAAALQAQWREQNAQREDAFRKSEAEARVAWREFFANFTAALASADFDALKKLMAVPPESPLRKGWVAHADEVLAACAADVSSLRALHAATLAKAAAGSLHVSLTLHKGQPVAGECTGLEGRKLRVRTHDGPVVGVALENLTSAAFTGIFSRNELAAGKFLPVLWSLQACEQPAEAAQVLAGAYKSADAMPPHWRECFRLERRLQWEHDRDERLAALQRAVQGDERDDVVPALAALRQNLSRDASEPFAPEVKVLLEKAEVIAARPSTRVHLVLQNAVSPTKDFAGVEAVQISDYPESVHETGLPAAEGLKLGASGGLQRVLVRFEGLKALLGARRVRAAKLELHQLDSKQATGATLALYRIKSNWLPAQATWSESDAAKKQNWSVPGVSGAADVEDTPEAQVVLDNKSGLWRAFDVTRYAQDVASGKAMENGFLLRITNNEPEYFVRLAPASGFKDATLQMRLVLDLDQAGG